MKTLALYLPPVSKDGQDGIFARPAQPAQVLAEVGVENLGFAFPARKQEWPGWHFCATCSTSTDTGRSGR